MKIAVIGSGISGLSSAYFLSKKFKVDLFEKDDHFGGHSFTYEIKEDKTVVPVDLGFIVFNEKTYPNLVKFFKDLKVPYEKSDMSFSVSIKESNIEYSGGGFEGIFANKLNLFNLKFLNMIREIISFYKTAPTLIKNNNVKEETLGNYLRKKKFSKYFVEYHLIPMVAAIWSMPFSKAKEMPLKFFLNFFTNHGLFKLKDRPQWYTVTNRSKTYVKKVTDRISGEIFKNYKVNKITRSDDNVRLIIGNEYLDYDHVILASHADESLNILDNPTKQEKNILSKFDYVKNEAFLHSDESLMPQRKKVWSSWNSISNGEKTCITYWLNKLQNLNEDKNYFLTLNPIYRIKDDLIIKQVNFTHPYLNSENTKLQKKLDSIQGKKRTWYCGSYFGNGFHEDGLKSAINMTQNFENL